MTNDWLKSFNDPGAGRDRRRGDREQPRPARGRDQGRHRAADGDRGRVAAAAAGRRAARRRDRRRPGQRRRSTARSPFVGVAWELDVWGRLRAQRAVVRGELRGGGARLRVRAPVARRDDGEALVPRDRDAPAPRARRAGGRDLRRAARAGAGPAQRRARTPTSTWSTCAPSSRRRRARSSARASRTAKRAARSRCCSAAIPPPRSRWRRTIRPCPRSPAPGCRRRCSSAGPISIAAEREVLAAFRARGGRAARAAARVLALARRRATGRPAALAAAPQPVACLGRRSACRSRSTRAARCSAKVEIATAQQAQAVARYGAVALTAFREVENSLANERLLALQLPLDQKALDDRTEAVRIATIQYKAGRRDLLWVAQLQTAQLATEVESHQAARRAARQPGAPVPGAGRQLRRGAAGDRICRRRVPLTVKGRRRR